MTEYHEQSAKRMALAWIKVEPSVRAYVLSVVGNWNDAQDVVQAVAMTMIEKFGDYDESRPLLPWVLGIARLKMLEHRRRRGRDPLMLDEHAVNQLEAAFLGIADEIDPRRRALGECLENIASRQREAFSMRYGDDLPPRVIAEKMGATSAAISNLLNRGREALRRCIEHRLEEA